MSLHEALCDSAHRWAATALDSYVEDPPDLDFAVHHMAVAMEHLSKAYLCSLSEVLLLQDRGYHLDDLLILTGHEGRAKRKRSALKTIGGEGALDRVAAILQTPANVEGLRALREARNGVTHLGDPPAGARTLLAAGITYLNCLLTELGRPIPIFWGEYEPLTARLVVETVTDRQIRYERKLQAACEAFRRRFGKWPETPRAEILGLLSPDPGLFEVSLYTICPACGHPVTVEGVEYSRPDGPSLRVWFEPRAFHCPVCHLTLEGDELEVAGITGCFPEDREDVPIDWWRDSDDLSSLPEWGR